MSAAIYQGTLYFKAYCHEVIHPKNHFKTPIPWNAVSLLTCYLFCGGNINIYLHFISLLCIHMTKAVEILPPSKTRTCLFYIIDNMGADVLAPSVARASATMICIMLTRINSVSAHNGLISSGPAAPLILPRERQHHCYVVSIIN